MYIMQCVQIFFLLRTTYFLNDFDYPTNGLIVY